MVIAVTNADVSIPVTRLVSEAKVPTRGSIHSTGWDLYSVDNVVFEPGHRTLVDTGISMALPKGVYRRIAPRSGLAWKHGVTIGAGVIDRDYTGSIKVLLFNQGDTTVMLRKGDRIAQLIPEKYNSEPLKEVNQIPITERDAQGFGSTGINMLEPDLVEIYTINLMPTATDEALQSLMPSCYHHKLHLIDPEGPLKQQPRDRPADDFELQLDPTKPLPKPSRPYHMNPAEQADWIKWRDTMLSAGMILHAPANTPLAAPFFFVWKKDGTRHLVINYCKLNNITVKDNFPLPRIDETLE